MAFLRRLIAVFAVACLGTALPAHAQPRDSLPQLNAGSYVPSSLAGFQLDSRSGLSKSDRMVMSGVEAGAKAYWVKPDRPFRVVAFDVMTDIYRFNSASNARRAVQQDFRKIGGFDRDTIAGLPVVTAQDQATGTADCWVGYQQGTLGIRVSATQSVTSGSADMMAVRKAAWQAFRAVVKTACQRTSARGSSGEGRETEPSNATGSGDRNSRVCY